MPRKRHDCVDCGEPLTGTQVYFAQELCAACRENYERCSRYGELRHLRDMRQANCVSCRAAYDRDRWARQRAARAFQ